MGEAEDADVDGRQRDARGLARLGVEIVSTGGTAQELEGGGLDVRAVEDYTGFPEMLDGRVKTLNPRIYAGLLSDDSGLSHDEARWITTRLAELLDWRAPELGG